MFIFVNVYSANFVGKIPNSTQDAGRLRLGITFLYGVGFIMGG